MPLRYTDSGAAPKTLCSGGGGGEGGGVGGFSPADSSRGAPRLMRARSPPSSQSTRTTVR